MVLVSRFAYFFFALYPVMHHGQSTPRPYGHSVVTQIPLKRLSDHARRHPNNYSNLYPTLLKLMATQFPQLCLVCEWLTEKKAITGKECMPYCKKFLCDTLLKWNILQSTNLSINMLG